ncbi:MAG: DUF2029 domain-containing protein [Chloroflexi bacterium]|nr:DUF2029 domain-containing protein [Chloroflexota bacterium]
MKPKWQLLFFTLAHIVIFLILFKSVLYDQRFNASALYFDYASRAIHGQIPYQDFPLEYPPLALVFFILPRLLAPNLLNYTLAFTALILVFNLVGLFFIEAISRRLGISAGKALTFYTIALLGIGSIMDMRYDLIPAVIVLVALYALITGKTAWAFALLAVGTLTKIYPVVLAPIFVLYYFRQKQYRPMLSGAAVFAGVAILMSLPFIIMAPSGFWESFAYHAKRGLQLESTYASILLLGYTLRLIPVQLEFSYGSWNLAGTLPDILAGLSTFLVIAALLGVYWLYYRNHPAEKAKDPFYFEVSNLDAAYILNYSTLAILAFMVPGKVLSPQFLVWLYPMVPLIMGPWRPGSWLTFVLISLMSYYIFPLHYLELLGFQRAAVDVLLWRNLLLAGFAGILLWKSTGHQIKLPDEYAVISENMEEVPDAQSCTFRDRR